MDVRGITVRHRAGDRVLRVAGELDAYSAPHLAQLLTGAGDPTLLDLARVTFIDCGGLRAVVALRQRVDVEIVAMSSVVERLLDLTGLRETFTQRDGATVPRLRPRRSAYVPSLFAGRRRSFH